MHQNVPHAQLDISMIQLTLIVKLVKANIPTV
jgi:hypothetical protein